MKLQAGGFWTCNLVNSAKSWQTAQKKKKKEQRNTETKNKNRKGEKTEETTQLLWCEAPSWLSMAVFPTFHLV